MKTINETFEDEEFDRLKKLKGDKISWRVFIMLMYEHCKEAEKRGDFEIIIK